MSCGHRYQVVQKVRVRVGGELQSQLAAAVTEFHEPVFHTFVRSVGRRSKGAYIEGLSYTKEGWNPRDAKVTMTVTFTIPLIRRPH